MSKVTYIHRKESSVERILKSAGTLTLESVIVFGIHKDGDFQIITSEIDKVTNLLGALERIKFELLTGG